MGIFDAQVKDQLFTRYRATLQVRGKLMGGIPKDPKIIQGWLKSKAKIDQDDELLRATVRTLREQGIDVPDQITSFADIEEIVDQAASLKTTNGFKQDATGLYLEARCIKAMLKEAVSILYSGKKWTLGQKADGKDYGKAPRSIAAERVFVEPEHIYLGRTQPDDVDLQITHVDSPTGKKTSLTYIEYVVQPSITFDVLVTEDSIKQDDWARIWVQAQENGLGARRSQEFGKFDILGFDRMNGKH